jgi:hypothetical protein
MYNIAKGMEGDYHSTGNLNIVPERYELTLGVWVPLTTRRSEGHDHTCGLYLCCGSRGSVVEESAAGEAF